MVTTACVDSVLPVPPRPTPSPAPHSPEPAGWLIWTSIQRFVCNQGSLNAKPCGFPQAERGGVPRHGSSLCGRCGAVLLTSHRHHRVKLASVCPHLKYRLAHVRQPTPPVHTGTRQAAHTSSTDRHISGNPCLQYSLGHVRQHVSSAQTGTDRAAHASCTDRHTLGSRPFEPKY